MLHSAADVRASACQQPSSTRDVWTGHVSRCFQRLLVVLTVWIAMGISTPASAAVPCPSMSFGSWMQGASGAYAKIGFVTADGLAKTCANGSSGGAETLSVTGAFASPVPGPSSLAVSTVTFYVTTGGVQQTVNAMCSGSCSASGASVTVTGLASASASVSYVDVTGQTVSATLTINNSSISVSSFSVQGGVYDATGPIISSLSPVTGYGGTAVTLSGGGFSGATGVTFGTAPAQSFSVVNASTITAVVPDAPTGAVSVSVTSPAGTSTRAGAFTYVLQPQAPIVVTASPTVLAAGETSIISASGGSGTGAFTYSSPGTTCTLNGTTLTANAPGSCRVTATKAADSVYAAASASVTVSVSKFDQAPLTATAYPGDIAIGQTSSIVTAGGSGTGAITRTITSGAANCSISGTVLTGVAAGQCTVTATKAGDNQYNPASASAVIVVGKTAQAALTVTASPAAPTLGAPASLTTSGGSGTGAVSYVIANTGGTCTLSGSTVIMTGLSSCIIRAIKDGDATYAAATATTTVSIGGAVQATLSLTASPSTIGVGASSILSSSGGSGTGAISYRNNSPTKCSLAGDVVTGLAAGQCSLTAIKEPDATYAPAYANLIVNISQGVQAGLNVTASPSAIATGGTASITALGGSGAGGFTFALTAGSSFCSLASTQSSATVTGLAAGTCTVAVTKAADLNYLPVTGFVTIDVGKLPQAALTVSATPAALTVATTSALATTGGSGSGAVSYAITAGATLCSVTGSKLTGTGVGTCTITATKAGDATYGPVTAAVDVTVGRGTQAAMTLTASPGTVGIGNTSALAITGGSGTGNVSYAVTAGGSFCSIAGSTLTGLSPGTCTVTATKAADLNYAAASETASVTVALATTPQAALTVSASPAALSVGTTSAISAAGGSGSGATAYAISAGSTFCSISGNIVTGIGAGSCTATATKAGDNTYLPASGSVTFAVSKGGQATLSVSASPSALVTGDTSAISSSGGTGTGAVTYAVTTGGAFCSLTGTTLSALGAGTCVITATKAADANYLAATATVTVAVGKAPQTSLTLAALPAAIAYKGTSALSVAGGSGTGAVSYAVTAGSAFCSVSGTTLTGNAPGTCTVTATKAGDANYLAATATASVTVSPAAQAALMATAAPSVIAVNATSALSAGGGSGTGAVSFAVSAGSSFCTVSGSTLKGTGAGVCTVTATKAADANYLAATATTDVTVGKAAQAALSATATPATIVVNATSTLTTSGGSGTGAVTFAVSSGGAVCSVAGAVLTGTGAGACTVTATKAGDANYAAATATVNLTVGKAAQAPLVASATPSAILVNATSALSAAGGSGTGAISFAVTVGGSFCSVSGSTLTGTGAGSCTVTATKAADANYSAASSTVAVTVGKAVQATLTATASPSAIVYNGTSTLGTAGGSGTGAVTFAVTAGQAFCAVTGTSLKGAGAGTCTVTATKAADANYAVAVATVDVVVSKAPQSALSLSAAPAAIGLNATSQLSTSGGSGTGAVSYALTAGGASCALSGKVLTGTALGLCTVTATKAADANYTAATASADVTVGAAGQTITFVKPSNQTFVPGAQVALSATASSGLPVAFASATATVCSVSGASAVMVSAGTCTIKASQAGNANYLPAPVVTQSFSINGIATTVSLTATPAPSGSMVTFTATVSPAAATGTVTFKAGASPLCADVVPVNGVATCKYSLAAGYTVTATFRGTGSYADSASAPVGSGTGGPAGRVATTAGQFIAQRQNLTASTQFSGERQVERLADYNRSAAGQPAGLLNDSGSGDASRFGAGPGLGDLARLRTAGKPRGTLGSDLGLRQGAFEDQDAAAGLPAVVSGSTEGASQFSFATSLSQIARHSADSDAAKLRAGKIGGALGLTDTDFRGSRAAFHPFDMWVEGRYTGFRDDRSKSGLDGHFGVVSIGADYVMNKSFLIGAFVQFDSLRQDIRGQANSARGTGWMAGPYATFKVSENVYWQARAGWGRASNEVGAETSLAGKFDSERKLVSTTLTGRWEYGAWMFQPAVSVSYLEESASSVTGTTGVIVPETDSRLGQAKAGPVVSYRHQTAGGLSIEPRLGLQVVWDFAAGTTGPGLAQIDGAKAGGLRGRSEAGVRAMTAGGIALDLSGSYDGIGSPSYTAITGNASLRVPLN